MDELPCVFERGIRTLDRWAQTTFRITAGSNAIYDDSHRLPFRTEPV